MTSKAIGAFAMLIVVMTVALSHFSLCWFSCLMILWICASDDAPINICWLDFRCIFKAFLPQPPLTGAQLIQRFSKRTQLFQCQSICQYFICNKPIQCWKIRKLTKYTGYRAQRININREAFVGFSFCLLLVWVFLSSYFVLLFALLF